MAKECKTAADEGLPPPDNMLIDLHQPKWVCTHNGRIARYIRIMNALGIKAPTGKQKKSRNNPGYG